jgi:ABC-type branched-subunit amino acid transport system substrate-binding protein
MKLAGVKSIQFLPGALPTAALVENPVTTVAKKYGITITGRTEIPLTAADYTPYVSDAATAKADVYVPVIAPFMTNLLLQAMQQLGLKMRIAIGERQFSEEQYKTYGQPGGPLDGALLADVIPPISAAADYPELQRALDEIGAYYKSSNNPDAAPEKLSTVVTTAWLAVEAFAKVADAQTDITAASIMNGLGTMKDIDLGLLKWTPSAKGPVGFEKASNSMQYLSTVKDGKVVMFQKDPIDALASFR